jgi:hypothetical protein
VSRLNQTQFGAAPEQLKLFMTGQEWKSYATHSTDGPLPRLWEEKEAQARTPRHDAKHGSGVYDSMKQAGWDPTKSRNSTPTIVFEDSPSGKQVRRVQSEGHHRVAAAAAVEAEKPSNPIYIPTNYVDNTAAARARRRVPYVPYGD